MKEISYLEGALTLLEQQKIMQESAGMMKNIFDSAKYSNTAITSTQPKMKIEDFESMKEDFEEMRDTANEISEFFKKEDDENEIEEDLDELENEMKNNEKDSEKCECQKKENENINKDKEEKNSPKKEEEIIKLDLNNKEDVMKIINSQNFVEGYWDINRKTMNIKNKYETEFNKLKELKILNNNDIIAMTIIVIYFIYNNYKEIINELIMIIKKGKLYIQNKTGDSYDNIIKMIES